MKATGLRAGILTASFVVGSLFQPIAASARPQAASMDNSCWNYKPSERGFAKKINEERSDLGIGKLSIDPELSKAARKQTNDMVKTNDLHHTTPEEFRRRVTMWTLIGENVGVGSTVSSLHAAFMASPLHTANVLNGSFKHVGVGVRQEGDRMWVTIIFEAATDPGTTLPMPSC